MTDAVLRKEAERIVDMVFAALLLLRDQLQQEGGPLTDSMQADRTFADRLTAWIRHPARQPAIVSFTAGTLRIAASLIEETERRVWTEAAELAERIGSRREEMRSPTWYAKECRRRAQG